MQAVSRLVSGGKSSAIMFPCGGKSFIKNHYRLMRSLSETAEEKRELHRQNQQALKKQLHKMALEADK